MQSKQIIDGRFLILHTEKTGSTNSDLVDMVKSDEEMDKEKIVVLVADYQTEGRGRLGRSWEAEPDGALLASLAISQVLEEDLSHNLVLSLALATRDVVASFLKPEYLCQIKWPNDLIITGHKQEAQKSGGEKLAGILAEFIDTKSALVVGIGINLKTPKLLDASSEMLQPVGLNDCSQLPVDKWDLLTQLLKNFGSRCDRLCGDYISQQIAEAEEHLAWQGQHVVLWQGVTQQDNKSQKKIEGKILGLGSSGQLILETEAGSVSVQTGDILRVN